MRLKMLRKYQAMAAITVLAGLMAAGCGGDGGDEGGGGGGASDTYVVGANSAQSGYAAPFDQPALKGVEMAVQEINAAGGIDGKYKIELITRSNRSEAAQAAVTSRELISEGMQVMISPCDADLSIPAGGPTQKAKIPAISPCASTPTYPIAVGDFMFGNMPADNQQGTVLADYAIRKGYKTAWLLTSPDTAYTSKLPGYFATVFKKKGGSIVGEQTYKLQTQDFGPQINALKAIKPAPDVIMSSSYEPEFPAFMKQLRAAGVTTPVIESDGIDTATLPEVGDAVNGVVFTTAGFPAPGSKVEDFYAKYKDKTGSEPDTIVVALGYETMQTIAAAVEMAGSTDGQAVRDAIASLKDFEGVVSPITYEGMQGMPLRSVSLVEIRDGKRLFEDEVRPNPSDIPPVSE